MFGKTGDFSLSSWTPPSCILTTPEPTTTTPAPSTTLQEVATTKPDHPICCISGRCFGGGSTEEREAEGEDQRSEAAIWTHWKAGKGHPATVGEAIGPPNRGDVWLHHQSWRSVGEKTKTKGENS